MLVTRRLACWLLAAWSVLSSFAQPAYACTEWMAAGVAVDGGGTLIVKNRDEKPDHLQELRLFTPADGYRYFGLAVQGTNKNLKGGINEQGLVVFNQAASTVPKAQRKATPSTVNRLLSQCKDVDEALQLLPQFKGPLFLNIADRQKIASIELGLDGAYAVTVKTTGILYHTNHYVTEALAATNQRDYPSSTTRYDRIGELLAMAPGPYTLQQFIDFSQDQNDGPDNSLWRTGSTPDKVRSLATFAVQVPPTGSPLVYVLLANPGEDPRAYWLQADEVFSGAAGL